MSLAVRGTLLASQRGFLPTMLPGLQLWLPADRGNVYTGGAAQFTRANSESLSIADNAALSMGDNDFMVGGWCYFDSLPAASLMGLMCKDTSGAREYRLYADVASNVIEFDVYNGVNTVIGGAADLAVGLATATWFFVVAYHDAVNNLVGISINGRDFLTFATTGTGGDGNSAFALGNDQAAASRFHDGRMAHCFALKSPPGGIAAIATTVRDTLYNSASGRDLAQIDSATRTAWGAVAGWRLQEVSGNRADSWGSNTLTDNNTVTENPGPFLSADLDADPVRQGNDQSGRANNATQSTGTKKPTYRTGILNGKPILRHVAASLQDLRTASIAHGVGTGDFCWFAVITPTATAVAAGFNGILANGAFVPALYLSSGKVNLWWGSAHAFDSTLVAGTSYILTIRRASGVVSCRINGTQEATTFALATSMGSGVFAAGSDGNAAFHDGDLTEPIFYANDPGLSNIQRVERYLGKKYGIAVA